MKLTNTECKNAKYDVSREVNEAKSQQLRLLTKRRVAGVDQI